MKQGKFGISGLKSRERHLGSGMRVAQVAYRPIGSGGHGLAMTQSIWQNDTDSRSGVELDSSWAWILNGELRSEKNINERQAGACCVSWFFGCVCRLPVLEVLNFV